MVLRNKYGELRSGWALTLVLLVFYIAQFGFSVIIELAAVLLVMVNGGADLLADNEELLFWLAELAQFWVVLLTTGAVLLLFWLLYKRPLSHMGLQRKGWLSQLLMGCLFGIAAMGMIEAVLLIFGWGAVDGMDVSRFAGFSFWGQFVFWLGLFVAAGFSEEILARGFMMTALKTTRLKGLILFLPAVFFSLMHLLNNHVTPLSLLNIMLAGIVFGYMFLKSGGLWAPVAFHITWNVLQGNIFGMAVSGNNTPSLINTVLSGPDWVSGGAFGAEGGVVCTAVLAVSLVGVHFFVRPSRHGSWSLDSDMPLKRGAAPIEGKAAVQPKTDASA